MRKISRKVMLLLLFVGYIFVYIDKTVIGFALLPIRQEFHLSTQQAGYITGAFFLSYAIFQLPAGWLNDRVGYKKVLFSALMFLALSAMLLGVLGQCLALLIAFRFLDGMAHSGYPSACAKAVSTHFPLHQRTFAQSFLLSSSGIAMALGPLLAVWALAAIGWHDAFMVLAVLVALTAVTMLWLPTESMAGIAHSPPVDYRALLRIPKLWQLLFASICINIPVYGLMAWLPAFLVQQQGVSIATTGMLISLAGVGSWLSSLVSGWWVGRFMSGREPRVILCATLIAAVGMLVLLKGQSLWTIGLALLVTDAALICAFITTFTLPMKCFSPAVVGSTIGLINAGGVSGGVIGPVVMGYLLSVDHGRYQGSFFFLIVMTVIAGLILLPGRRHLPVFSPLQE